MGMVKRVPGDGGAETAPSQERCLPFTSYQASGTSNSTSASRSPVLTVTPRHAGQASSPLLASVSPPARWGQDTRPTFPRGCREVIPGRDMTTQESR